MVARKRCCKTIDPEGAAGCPVANMRFCIEGAVQAIDPGAVVIWGDSLGSNLQQQINQQYILRGDRCGCSQAADLSDRALAQANGLNAKLPFDIVSAHALSLSPPSPTALSVPLVQTLALAPIPLSLSLFHPPSAKVS